MKKFLLLSGLFLTLLLSSCKNDVPSAPAEPAPKPANKPPTSVPKPAPARPQAPSL